MENNSSIKAEKTLVVLANIFLYMGIICAVIIIGNLAVSWVNGFETPLMEIFKCCVGASLVILSSFLTWGVLNVLVNISLALREKKNG